MIGIYKITERLTGRCYIGQSTDIPRRWKLHRKRFKADMFDYEVLLKCPVESLDFLERAFISGYDSITNGFNKTAGGLGRFGFCDDEMRKKMSDVHTGKKLSDEHRSAQSAARRGVPHSEEHTLKIAKSNTGKKRSDEARRKMSEAKQRYLQAKEIR